MAETEIITAVLKAEAAEEENNKINKEDDNDDELLTLNKPTEPVVPSDKKEVEGANPQEAEKKEVPTNTAEATNAADNEVEGEGKVEQVVVQAEQNKKEATQTNDAAALPSSEAPEHLSATGVEERPGFPLRTSLRHIGTSLKDVFTGHLPHVGLLHLAETKAAQDEEHLKRFIQRHKWDKVMELLLEQEEESLKQEFKQAADDDLKIKEKEAKGAKDTKEQEEVKNEEEGGELLQSSKSFTEDEDSILKTLDDTVEDLKHKQDVNEVIQEQEHEAATETKEEKTVATKDDALKAAPVQGKRDDEKGLPPSVTIHKDNLLHLMCRHHPPACVIEKTIQLKHHLVSELNENMECPLHVATSHGASPKVVQLLIDSYPLAVSWQDDRGRTPLHGHLYECSQEHKYCCDPGHYMVEGSEGREEENLHHYKPLLVQGPLLDVIQHLCNQMSPDDMGLQDKFGHIPLEIAKYYDCDHITLAVIKEAM